ncbi:hypothetical protein H5410_009611 [Solanum commersonii]|uniref:Uncharacterized protein n=1 Tax=Solanum commersonii TaxID=4109 RepID=A0A9J6AIW8_SOLCO|nr:hypothetical protein H5410_009611 [Solanum commersonii]
MKEGKGRNMSGFAGNNGDGLGHETMGRGETIMGRFRRVSRQRMVVVTMEVGGGKKNSDGVQRR